MNGFGTGLLGLLVGLLALVVRAGAVTLDDFGAIPDDDSITTCVHNSRAIEAAFKAASVRVRPSERVVLVPADTVYYISAVQLTGMDDMTLQVDGTLRVSNGWKVWPRDDSGHAINAFQMLDMHGFTLQGTGTIDGQGYDWWWEAIIGGVTDKFPDSRPNLFDITNSNGLEMTGVRLINSPRYHVDLHDSMDAKFHDFEIYVDVFKQQEMLAEHGLLTGEGLPTFPLNTDGIDPSAVNVEIWNMNITNFDDAVAVKPCHGGNKYCTCSSNIFVHDIHVTWGVGATIGSVPPNENHNCVANVTFRDITFETPLKAVYVKTNPGDTGTGEITNITYENLAIDKSVWWTIYIGPQQQEQPDGTGPGCMTYPLNPDCPTQPLVPMKDISLINVTAENGLNPYPGVVRCNETNPCTGFVFDNVHVSEHFDTWEYLCENIYGEVTNSDPVPECFLDDTRRGLLRGSSD